MRMIMLSILWNLVWNKWKCVCEVLAQLLRQFFLASTKYIFVKGMTTSLTFILSSHSPTAL